MLHTFVAEHRDEIIRRCRGKVELRAMPPAAPGELTDGIPQFVDQLVDALRQPPASNAQIDASAALHGRERRLQGFTVSQVVHDYGDVCQSITDLAVQLHAPIAVEDFRTLNRCLDDAIASAVTEHAGGHQSPRDVESGRDDDRLGVLVHEIRNLVGTASVAFEVLRKGNVGVQGSTGGVLQRSLTALVDLINRSFAEVRLRRDIRDCTRIGVAEFIAEIAIGAALEAGARGLSFNVEAGDVEVYIEGDRPILAATVANLLQNAFKFTRPATHVTLRATSTYDRVLIEVEDACGGLPQAHLAGLVQPFEQRGADRTGLGLGLAISRLGAEANNGRISARDLPGRGCVFALDLPRLTMPAVSG